MSKAVCNRIFQAKVSYGSISSQKRVLWPCNILHINQCRKEDCY